MERLWTVLVGGYAAAVWKSRDPVDVHRMAPERVQRPAGPGIDDSPSAAAALLARFLDTHAAAEAACGDTARAAQLQQEAVGLLPAGDKWNSDRAAFLQRLKMYRGK